SSTLLPIQEQPSQWAAPHNKDKGKAKATEEDEDEESEAAQKLRKELDNFVVPDQTKHVKLVQAAKAFLEWQSKLSQFLILEGFKGKGKAKALLGDSEQMGTKQAFKSTELVDSNSDKEEEEERVCVIKKIKHKHVEELIGVSNGKEIIELEDLEDEMVVPKTPVAGPLCQTLKPMVLVPSMPKPISKPTIVLASSVAGSSTAQIVPSSAPKSTATMPISKPAPVKSAGKPAVKGGSVFKDPFIVRQFRLVGTEESSALIINQVTEVAAGKVTSIVTQETLQGKDTGDENDNNEDGNDDEDDNDGSKDNDNDSNDDNNAAMDIDSVLNNGETMHMAIMKWWLKCWRMLEGDMESVHQELQWTMHQHNALALYLHNCDLMMDWHEMNNVELGEFSDTKDLPII
ncbi:hypothetical protein C0995_004081, partial [Termitomyces sp. Mi166